MKLDRFAQSRKSKDRFAQRLPFVLVVLFIVLCLAGCGTKKKVAQATPEPEVIEAPAVPAWHTCVIQNARMTINKDGSKFSTSVNMQVVRDSMLVISVTPLLGIELYRLEATPFEVIGFDKMQGQYARTTYHEINRKLTPNLNWDTLQELCSAELPLGSERARLIYTFGDDVVEIVVEYPMRRLDSPVRLTSQPLNRYTQVDISKWL